MSKIFTAIFLLLALISSNALAVGRCQHIYEINTSHFIHMPESSVPNAEVKAEDYSRVFARTLKDHINSVLDNIKVELPIKEFIENLFTTSSPTILDVGGGLSLYGLELAQRGARVTVINAQKMYDLLERFKDNKFLAEYIPDNSMDSVKLADRRNVSIFSPSDKRRVDPINGSVLASLAEVFELEVPNELRTNGFYRGFHEADAFQLREQSQNLVLQFLEQKQRLVDEGKFNYLVGLAQKVLTQISDSQFDGAIDRNGAFYYSIERLELIDHYFRVLKPGKSTLILEDWGDDFSKVEVDGKQIPLRLYLAEKWPQYFKTDKATTGSPEFGRHEVTALLLTKPLTEEEEPPLFSMIFSSVFQGYKEQVPKVIFHPKN